MTLSKKHDSLFTTQQPAQESNAMTEGLELLSYHSNNSIFRVTSQKYLSICINKLFQKNHKLSSSTDRSAKDMELPTMKKSMTHNYNIVPTVKFVSFRNQPRNQSI